MEELVIRVLGFDTNFLRTKVFLHSAGDLARTSQASRLKDSVITTPVFWWPYSWDAIDESAQHRF
jgi:hypothetical protein